MNQAARGTSPEQNRKVKNMTINQIQETPRVWVGCLACYNDGRLIGEWLDADECEDATPQSVGCKYASHEEPWCFDHEGWSGALSGEVSPMEAARVWADEAEPVFKWAEENGVPVAAAYEAAEQYDGSADWLAENYIGTFGSLREYAEECIEGSGTLDDVPEFLRNYIDYESYGADLRHDVAMVELNGDLYLFHL